jgi:trans-aconitate methyltransferase
MSTLRGQELELVDYLPHLLGAADLHPGETVVDVGCGTGGPTVAAAYRAAPGAVVGIDYQTASVETARSRVPAGLVNLSYVVADAATHRPELAPVDVVISRFGLMFFKEPTSALTNIASWLGPGGRLATLVWQPMAQNPWVLETNEALTGDPAAAGTALEAALPFSLGDPELLADVLARAGFTDIAMTAVHEPVHLGATLRDAMDFVLSWYTVQDVLAALTPPAAEQRRDALASTLSRHVRADGRISLPSTAWLVGASAPGSR